MTIDYPKTHQIPELTALWEIAFGDTEEFLTPFFEIAYTPERCRGIWLEGRLAAMLYWFPCSCDGQKFAYVYAVATEPEFRGRGLCRQLMEDTAEILKAEGYDGILLYPATESLVQMYRKMGFEHCTTVDEFTCEAGTPVRMQTIDFPEYKLLRRQYLPEGGVVQEGALLEFLAGQATFYKGADFVAVVSEYDGKLHCQELLGSRDAAPGILGALEKNIGFFRMPGVTKSFVMGRPLTGNCVLPWYFGLPLD